MTSKEALEGLIDAYISWRAYQTRECIENDYRYKKLLKDLDCLEKLEKVIEILKARVKMLETHHEPKSRYYYLYIGGRIVLLSREEYELLKEVLENEKINIYEW